MNRNDSELTRRQVLKATAGFAATRYIPIPQSKGKEPLKIGVITDLHHGLAPDAAPRLAHFVRAVERRNDLDLVLQMGDFCHARIESSGFMDLWNEMRPPKVHVLGNHDMDMVDKQTAMKHWGMASRYGSSAHKGYRLVVLDLNHFKKDGKLFAYEKGNYYAEGAQCNWADPEQLDWLSRELNTSREPVILISHQPLGFKEPNQPMPEEQLAVLDIVTKAAKANPAGAVAISIFGHLHVDRLEYFEGIPCLCVNSASYFWYQGMHPYTNPLYTFLEVADGFLKVQAAAGQFVKPPPKPSDSVIGRSASISGRRLALTRSAHR